MAAQNRAIRPKPPQDDSAVGYAQAGPSRGSRRRATNIGVACTACQNRRTKCDGIRPLCHSCEVKGSECFYEVRSGVTRAEARIERIEKLEADNATLLEILGVLKNKSSDVANAFLQFIRGSNFVDLAELRRWVKEHLAPDCASSSGSPAIWDPSLFESMESMSASEGSWRESYSQSRSTTKEPFEEESTEASTAEAASTVEEVLTPSLKPNPLDITVQSMTNGLNAFFDCAGILHYTFSREQADHLVRSTVESTAVPAMTKFRDLLKQTTDLRKSAYFAELSAMAAVGIYYGQRSDPNDEFPAGVSEYFYKVAKLTLDSSIETNPLQAMKVCLLLAIYNIVLKPSIALAHVELGLSLGNRHGMDKLDTPPMLSGEAFLDYTRAWRTLVLISGWLGANRGYIPSRVTGVLQLWYDEKHIGQDEIVQLELIKITIIKSKIIHTVSDEATTSDATITRLCQELRNLYEELPEWMAFSSLQARIHEDGIGRAVFYFHLFYLSAMQFLHRRAIANCLVTDDAGGLSFVTPSSNDNYAVREGLMAAKMASRALALIKADGNIVQNSWLYIWSAYTAGVIIMHAAVRKALNHFPLESRLADMTLATTCMEILEYCGQVDDVAPRFLTTLQSYFDVLKNAVPGSINEDLGIDIQEEQSVEYLFGTVHGESDLQQASRDLLSLLQRPFQTVRELVQPTATRPLIRSTLINWMEAALGTPEEWIWELRNSNIDVGYGTGRVDQMEEIVSTFDATHFVEPGPDAGWQNGRRIHPADEMTGHR